MILEGEGLTSIQTAKILGISPQLLSASRAKAKRGEKTAYKIPFYQVGGGKVTYKKSDVLEFIEKHKTTF